MLLPSVFLVISDSQLSYIEYEKRVINRKRRLRLKKIIIKNISHSKGDLRVFNIACNDVHLS